MKEIISVLSAQIKAAEDNDPEIVKERERQAKAAAEEKKILAEQRNKARQVATYNIKRIIGGLLIIGVTILLCVISMSNSIRMHTYLSGVRSIVGFIITFIGAGLIFVLLFSTPKITKNVLLFALV